MPSDELELLLKINLRTEIEYQNYRADFFRLLGVILFIIGFSLMLVFLIMHETNDSDSDLSRYAIYYYLVFSFPMKFIGFCIYYFGKKMKGSIELMKDELSKLIGDDNAAVSEV